MPVTPTTGKFGGKSAWLLVDGFNLISAKLQSLRYKIEALQEKTDGLGDLWDEHTPCGMAKAELAQEGAYFDTSAGGSHEALQAGPPSDPQAVPRVVLMGFAGNEIGQPMVGFEGMYQQSYEVLSQVGKLQRANAEYTISGQAERGVVLHSLTTETADATTEPASSVDSTTVPQAPVPITGSDSATDRITTSVPHKLTAGDKVLISGHTGSTPDINGEQTVATVPTDSTFTIGVDITVNGTGGSFLRAKTQRGGAGYLQITALTLGTHTGVRVTHRHSEDNISFVDLLAMTDVTVAARTAERKTVTGAVRRYMAQSIDFLGAGSGGSCTYLAGFARFF